MAGLDWITDPCAELAKRTGCEDPERVRKAYECAARDPDCVAAEDRMAQAEFLVGAWAIRDTVRAQASLGHPLSPACCPAGPGSAVSPMPLQVSAASGTAACAVAEFEEDPIERLSMQWLEMPASFMEELGDA